MHVFDPGMRFWPQPSQLKMPKYAAASNSGCVSFAALAARGSAAATNELAAACARTGAATGPQRRQGLLSFAAGGELSHTSAGELLPRQQRGRSDAWLRYTGRLPQTIAGVLQPRAPLPTPWECSLPKLCRLQNASIYAALASSTGFSRRIAVNCAHRSNSCSPSPYYCYTQLSERLDLSRPWSPPRTAAQL